MPDDRRPWRARLLRRGSARRATRAEASDTSSTVALTQVEQPRRPDPRLDALRRAMFPAFVAILLAVVGSTAGITVVKRGANAQQQRVVAQGAGGASTGTDSTMNNGALSQQAAGAPVAQANPQQSVPSVAPLGNRVDPDLFVSAPQTITQQQVAAVQRATRASQLLQVDFANVKLEGGQTSAVGVDPSTFRNYTPDNTAPVDALWQRIASGDIAVAHAVAQALNAQLGSHVKVGNGNQHDERVGAWATTRLPGVGVVADKSRSAEMGLTPNAALLIVLPSGADPISAAAAVRQAIPNSDVAPLRYVVSTGFLPTQGQIAAPGGIPVLGRGWTIPLRPGTFTFSQAFGHNGHPGVDLAAPWGTPIYAASEGDVLYWGPAQGFGNWIVLQHPNGIQTVYGHMRADELIIPPHAHVLAGQLIARVGSEGNSTGPHLHFEVHVNNVRVDPVTFLHAQGVPSIPGEFP